MARYIWYLSDQVRAGGFTAIFYGTICRFRKYCSSDMVAKISIFASSISFAVAFHYDVQQFADGALWRALLIIKIRHQRWLSHFPLFIVS